MPFMDTSLLRVGYEDLNPQGHHAVVLVHGWPDSPRTWQHVAPELVKAGYRVIVPALRGFAPTTFLRPETPRSGQLASFGRDLLEFIDALGLDKPALVGHDWGARAVAIASGLRPGGASHMVTISVGYGTNDPNQPVSVEQARNYWYHWYMNTPRGRDAVRHDRRALSKLMWVPVVRSIWTPIGEFSALSLSQSKPPLLTWLLAAAYAAFGRSELVSRLVPVDVLEQRLQLRATGIAGAAAGLCRGAGSDLHSGRRLV